MRATLHDELMHEAGFETDYHRELERRRERRRRTQAWAVANAGLLVLLVAGLIELWANYLPGLPRPVVVTAVVVLFVAQGVQWVRRFMGATEGEV
jgi:O-antigen/teichoic acid export membrane protein